MSLKSEIELKIMNNNNYVKNFNAVSVQDIADVGGKNASLGQMIGQLSGKGIAVPPGFAITSQAYRDFLQENGLEKQIKTLLKSLRKKTLLQNIASVGKKIRNLILNGSLSVELKQQILYAYKSLSDSVGVDKCAVAVRSSATAEDLPGASFAGQQESFLNIKGESALLSAYKKCLASLFTDRAIAYRIDKGFNHMDVALSVGIQYMVRSDKACSGVMFTIDTETGFKEAIVISASYGLGETIVQGEVVPDEFHIFKPMLDIAKDPIIKKVCGTKNIMRVLGGTHHPVVIKKVPKTWSRSFCLTDKEIVQLARYSVTIEKHYTQLKGSSSPMDIEWAKDGVTGQLYIVQARPETVHADNKNEAAHILELYTVGDKAKAHVLATGQSIGQKVATGKAIVFKGAVDVLKVKKGDVLITRMTDPDSVPAMKKAAGIITQSGGRTCHAAIVSRELGIPAIVGAESIFDVVRTGQKITLDCSQGTQGFVYDGWLPIEKQDVQMGSLKAPKAHIYVNIAAPDRAYGASMLPVDGVGLARLEFIIAHDIAIHPMALIQQSKLSNQIRKKIKELTAAYANPQDFFVQKIAQGVGTIGAAFYPRPVIVRFSDFKSNEYRNLIGGSFFEPFEENPMIGLRGASRYYNPLYQDAFELECKALCYVRDIMGLSNVHVMIPFVRTTEEAQRVLALMKKYGLESGVKGLKVFMMCEIPSNVILIDTFAQYFDGFSIGSNDLTQTTLAADRDSGFLASLFNEKDPAVLKMIEQAISGAHKAGKTIGICGQAPSDYPEIADFLLKHGIDSLSLNQDSVIPFLHYYNRTSLV